MMKLILLVCFAAMATANVEETNIRCVSGFIAFDNSVNLTVYEDNHIFRLCPIASQECDTYQLEVQSPDGPAFVVGGQCSIPDFSLTCDGIASVLPEGQTLTSCITDRCSGGDCATFYQTYSPNFPRDVPRRCEQGTKAYINGTLVFNNATVDDCPPGSDSCLQVRSRYSSVDGEIDAFTGLCGFPGFNTEAEVCSAFAEYTAPDQTLLSCELLNCPEDFDCLVPDYETCPVGYTGYEDVQVLPGCTIREFTNGFFQCLGPLMQGYPYNNETECRSNIDDSISCLLTGLGGCTAGQCLSVLAQFVPDLGAVIGQLQDVPVDVALTDLLSQFPDMSANITEIIGMFTCPTPGEVPEAIQGFLDAAQSAPIVLPISVCDPTLLSDVARSALSFIEAFYSASEHKDVCLAWGAMKSKVFSNIDLRCSVEGITGLLTTYLPQQSHAVPDIVSAMAIFVDIVKGVEIPDCETVQVCANGTVFSNRVNGPNYNPEEVKFVDCGPNSQCVLINGSDIVNGTEGFFQTAICSPAGAEVTCDDVAANPLITELGACDVSQCDSTAFCPSPVAFGASFCPIADDDIQILPQCTLREVLSGTVQCEEDLLLGYPYSDQALCRANLDSTIRCLAQGASTCVNGNCQTVLDAIPGFREAIQGFGGLLGQVQGLNDIFDYFGLDQPTRDVIYSFACPQGGQIPPLFEELVSQIPKLNLGEPLCDNNILDDVIELAISTARKLFLAEGKGMICEAVKSSQYYVMEWMARRCNRDAIEGLLGENLPQGFEGVLPLVEKASQILEEFAQNYEFPGCGDYRICPQGTRSVLASNGMNVFDNSTYALCPNADDMCANVYVTTNDNDVLVKSETGICTPYPFTCDDVRDFTGFEINDCDLEFCSERLCKPFSLEPVRSSTCPIPENDIQILPSCTLRETLNKTFNCVGGLVSGYPYSNQAACRSNLDETVRCVANVVGNCFGGECGTILSAIPGIEPILAEIGRSAGQINSLEDIFRMIPDIGNVDEIKEYAYMFACPAPGTLPPLLEDLLGSINFDQINFPEIPICGGGFLRNLANAGIDFVRAFYRAQNKQDFCAAFANMKMRVAAEVSSCDLERLEDILTLFLPQETHVFIPVITKAVNTVLGFLDQLEVPGCQGGTTTLPCDQYYGDESRCGVQKAWVCDYVNWKIDFFTVWLEEVVNYKQAMGIPVAIPEVACIQGFPTNMCRNGINMRVCNSNSPYTCPICWCADHEYSDLRQIYNDWKADYGWWKQAFAQYQSMIGGSNMGNSCY